MRDKGKTHFLGDVESAVSSSRFECEEWAIRTDCGAIVHDGVGYEVGDRCERHRIHTILQEQEALAISNEMRDLASVRTFPNEEG